MPISASAVHWIIICGSRAPCQLKRWGCFISSAKKRPKLGTIHCMASPPISSRPAELSSLERAICPSSRALRRFWVEASSVLSWALLWLMSASTP